MNLVGDLIEPIGRCLRESAVDLNEGTIAHACKLMRVWLDKIVYMDPIEQSAITTRSGNIDDPRQ